MTEYFQNQTRKNEDEFQNLKKYLQNRLMIKNQDGD